MRSFAACGAILCGATILIGCHSSQHAGSKSSGAAAQTTSGAVHRAVTMDGRFDDWPKNAATVADADWIYFRVTVQGQSAPLQASPETVALWLDADASAKTGQKMASPREASGLGVDEVIEFSPAAGAPGAPSKQGVVVYAPGASGARTVIPSAQAEVMTAPTYASDFYEVRISRHIDAAAAPQLAKALSGHGHAKAMFVLIGADGRLTGWSDPETFDLPAASAQRPVADAAIPTKPAGSVRILAWNVEKSGLMQNPGPFARTIQVLNPDILVLEEWETDSATATSWFTATVSGQHPWHAVAAKELGIVIVSPGDLSPLGPGQIIVDAGDAESRNRPVRFLAADVKTALGDVLIGGLHLKCCGTAGSPEDQRRIAEAQAINTAMKSAFAQAGSPLRVIAGDYNLVGTRTPLDMIRAGLDSDGSEMAVAPTMVLGDAAAYTWSDHATEFPDGRLDYAVYGDAGADVVNSFVLDTRRLSDKALARLGLDRTDSSASDHFPVVVDLKPKK